ncbi:MAG: hypothetical protein V3U03_06505 [Myxococcota bacterium]
MSRDWVRPVARLGVLLVALFLAAEAVARGRGGRGGGGGRPNISRSGPASHGSIRTGGSSYGGSRQSYGGSPGGSRSATGAGRTTAPTERPGRVGDSQTATGRERPSASTERPGDPGDREGQREEGREDRQDYRDGAREDRQDYADDVRGEYQEHEEWYEDRWKRAVGASLTVSAFRSLQCASSTVVVNGVTYYNCGSSWYQRGYSGGNVTYVVVGPPAGY